MIYSKKLDNFLRKYEELIDPEHKIFFYTMINELRSCLTEPFIYSPHGLHKKDCYFAKSSEEETAEADICNCIALYSRYQTLKKIYNLYAAIFKEPRWL